MKSEGLRKIPEKNVNSSHVLKMFLFLFCYLRSSTISFGEQKKGKYPLKVIAAMKSLPRNFHIFHPLFGPFSQLHTE